MCDLVNLSNCVMESNPGGNGWARRLRPKAFVGSLALEAGLVGAMLLWPLLSPAVLPMQAAVTPRASLLRSEAAHPRRGGLPQ